MFCPNCGTQLPDGSKFCDNCGARLDNVAYDPNYIRQPSQSYPQNNSQIYSGYNTAPTDSQAGNGEIPSNRYAWIIGAGTLIMLVITIILAVITRGDDEVVESLSYVITLAKIVLLWMDSRELKKCGYKISPLWYILGVFCAGPYLFVRAKQVDRNFKYFYLWIFSVIAVAVVFVVLLPMMR